MKFNITSNENKINFNIECDFNDPIVTILLDALKPKSITQPENKIEDVITQPLILKPVKQRKPRRTKAEIEEAAVNQEVEFTALNQLDLFKDQTDKIEQPLEIQTEQQETTEEIKEPEFIDTNVESKDKMDMDIEALKILLEVDKLTAVKYVKSKTGMEMLVAKQYCENLWKKHLEETHDNE
jgi:hypothetical protein